MTQAEHSNGKMRLDSSMTLEDEGVVVRVVRGISEVADSDHENSHGTSPAIFLAVTLKGEPA